MKNTWADCSTQMELPLRSFTQDYKDGYQTGLNWDVNWMPGGPHVYRQYQDLSRFSEDKQRLQREDQFKYDEYHRGFNDGLKLRFEADPSYAEWFNQNRGNGYKKYKQE